MFQSLLEDRFKLKFHRDTKVLPVYELVIGKNDYLADWLSKAPSVGRRGEAG